MAKKRITLFIFIAATLYWNGVTKAETAAQATNGSSDNIASTASTAINGSIGVPIAPVSSSSSPIVVPTKLQPEVAPKEMSTTTTTVKSVPSIIPSVPEVKNNTSATAGPKCVCDGALLPRLGDNGKEIEICQECKCQFEARNTTLIKVVVVIVIWIISILVIYMLFLMCLDPLLNKRVKANYQEHTNEDDDTTVFPPLPTTNNQELNSRANVLNRVAHQQDKWKRQVREQRRHIYDRRTMLN